MTKVKSSQVIPIQPIIQGLLCLSNPKNHLPPSHFAHQDQIISEETFNRTIFLYDAAIWAILLNHTGHQDKARKVLDFIAQHYHQKSGMIGNFEGASCIRNAFDIYTGDGILEWLMTPGPMTFLVFAYLDMHQSTKSMAYKRMAIRLGEALLKMQKKDGGVYDGDRSPDVVNTEPHMDAFMAFLRLYALTNEETWMAAAQQAYDFFLRHLYDAEKGMIHQGTLRTNPHATDAYTWTLLGKAGDFLSPKENIRLTDYYLEKCLVKSTLHLPNGKYTSLYGLDFSDPHEVVYARGGVHPMVSLEWTAGAAASLQVVAIRLWKAFGETGDETYSQKAIEYKALAEFLLWNISKGFYSLPDMKKEGLLGFYASGQSVPIGHGWSSMNFHYRDPADQIKKGGSLISAWAIFPAIAYNPLTGEYYSKDLHSIPLRPKDAENIAQKCAAMAKNRAIKENQVS